MNSTNQLPKFDGQRAREIAEHQFREGPPLRQKNIGDPAAEAIQAQLDLSERMDQFKKYMESEQFQTLMKIVELFEQPESLETIVRQVARRVYDLQKLYESEDIECDETRDKIREALVIMTTLHQLLNKFFQLLTKQDKI